ncbi:MAG: hypothetical protein UV61_C0004G0048 [Candidatus Gottesmanbacteria bacterium GW2011_GWB1_43_11]|uniref:Integral membrane protein n=1 Tax=Candidatus Gottesmanbacteria bacterium GW2011_GWB1_43_11 TaxID=1618446 RepID=A0A0G1CNS3_9BACT|nr:MAG: hypothetical protein UV04_C0007G0049 [Candidatus Gottesmanbacteria bacterium GW2011_GWA2_42_16]KKS55631.1 MAG: hypothetical protein UV17_C0009G0012 [Candidatus Gottesmanbacteria bacterium GW2011_GWA1_42_26]KKS82224.1 MAG: membrane protein [Candidatus Gottesmanbacteria bacterium GW2011_GWC1_43_10]KKS87122.1 MAG: hypothetical protein UV61_C0004G0048 [Candidatus Gottesmanbacteria bacterium GW2011_GWB1_43_11]OGG07618.1 MAG: hypothetical protein A2699_02195 [Candidatus Gottesmanbacteria bact
MKGLLRLYLFYLTAIFLTQQILTGSFTIGGGLKNFLLAAGILALLNLLVKPILNILFFPVNALTLGLFSLVVNALVFFIFLRLTQDVAISNWIFPGLTYNGLSLPQYEFNQIGTIFVASTFISLITNFFTFLVE